MIAYCEYFAFINQNINISVVGNSVPGDSLKKNEFRGLTYLGIDKLKCLFDIMTFFDELSFDT